MCYGQWYFIHDGKERKKNNPHVLIFPSVKYIFVIHSSEWNEARLFIHMNCDRNFLN